MILAGHTELSRREKESLLFSRQQEESLVCESQLRTQSKRIPPSQHTPFEKGHRALLTSQNHQQKTQAEGNTPPTTVSVALEQQGVEVRALGEKEQPRGLI